MAATKKSSGRSSANQQQAAGKARSVVPAATSEIDGVDDFAKSLTSTIAQLIELKDNESRESIARNVTRSLMEGQAARISVAVEEDRAKAARSNPDSLELALTGTMEALTKVQALFEAIEGMIRDEAGDPTTLAQIGLQVAGEAHEAAQRALPSGDCHG